MGKTLVGSDMVQAVDVLPEQNGQEQRLQGTGGDYFDTISSEESDIESDFSDESEDESVTDVPKHSVEGSEPNVIPILIHDCMRKDEPQGTNESHLRVQIQTPTGKGNRDHRKIPRTPVPGRNDPLSERLKLKLQSTFEELEMERRKRLNYQKYPLQLGNSFLLKKREERNVPI